MGGLLCSELLEEKLMKLAAGEQAIQQLVSKGVYVSNTFVIHLHCSLATVHQGSMLVQQ